MNDVKAMLHALKALEAKYRDADIDEQQEREQADEHNREVRDYYRRNRNVDDATGIRVDGEI